MTRFIAVALVGLLGAAGCESTPEAEIKAFCAHVCACESSLPSVQRQCVENCVEQIGPSEPPPGCVPCLLQLSCEELDFNDECQPVCSGGGGGDDI